MTVRMTFVLLALLACCGVSHAAKEPRWLNFAEDADLRYYLDQKSVLSLPDNVYLFWVKSIAKDKDYFKKEFNLNGLSYIFTSYELDCAVSRYRVRGSILFDKNRKELSKTLPGEEPLFEPVPPESMLELAQDEICAREDLAADQPEGEDEIRPPRRPVKGGRASAAPAVSTLAPPAVGEVVSKVPLPAPQPGAKGDEEASAAERGGDEVIPPAGPGIAAERKVKGAVSAAEPVTPPVPAVPGPGVTPEPVAPAEPPTMQ